MESATCAVDLPDETVLLARLRVKYLLNSQSLIEPRRVKHGGPLNDEALLGSRSFISWKPDSEGHNPQNNHQCDAMSIT